MVAPDPDVLPDPCELPVPDVPPEPFVALEPLPERLVPEVLPVPEPCVPEVAPVADASEPVVLASLEPDVALRLRLVLRLPLRVVPVPVVSSAEVTPCDPLFTPEPDVDEPDVDEPV